MLMPNSINFPSATKGSLICISVIFSCTFVQRCRRESVFYLDLYTSSYFTEFKNNFESSLFYTFRIFRTDTS